MGFEVVFGKTAERQLKPLGRTAVRVPAKMDLRVPAKKVLSAAASCYLGAAERTEGECKVSGKVVTRVIYIDEFDTFNSEERTDTFSEKISYKNQGAVVSVSPAAAVLETSMSDNASGSSVDVDNIVEIALTGLVEREVSYAAGLNGGAEAKREKITVASFSRMIEEKFTADERLELDKNCSGVLGVDVRAYIRDIDCSENRVAVKGCVCVNVIAVKNSDTAVIYNNPYEFDFNKTVTVQDIGADDTVIGNVAIGGVVVKAENKVKPELAVEVDLVFNGAAVTGREIEYAADALSFDNHLGLTPVGIEGTSCLPQSNSAVDIESNITMPAKTPYISKILAVSGTNISGINIVPADGKVTIEGVLTANVVYECEEKQIHTHEVEVPFNTLVKIDGIGAEHGIQAVVHPINCHIKARRGKELLVDAKLGLSIAGSLVTAASITGDIVMGEPKVSEDNAMMIYIASGKESLWDVAKKINIASSEIVKQNPHCANGVQPGDRLFIYRQNVINI